MVLHRCPFCDTPNCTGSTQQELVANLVTHGVLRDARCIKAFQALDRNCFQSRSPDPYLNPYVDGPLPIGFSVQMSAPHVHGYSLELLAPFMHTGGRYLDVGSGSGFMAAAISLTAGANSIVHAREHIPELAAHSNANVIDAGQQELLDTGRLHIAPGDGLAEAQSELYDAINCGAAAAEFPTNLVQQLKQGGRLVVPIGPVGQAQWLTSIDRVGPGVSGESIRIEQHRRVVFVPLTSAVDQLENPCVLQSPEVVDTVNA